MPPSEVPSMSLAKFPAFIFTAKRKPRTGNCALKLTTGREPRTRNANIRMAGNSNPQAQMAGLKGILRWTLEQQARGGDGTTESKEVTEEDRAWLREAMENMIDTTDHLKDCVDVLNNGHNANPVEQDDAVRQLQENALDKLMDIIDNVDFARDLGVIGGMEPLLLLLKHPKYPSLRWRAANVLGTVVQNAESCQQWAYDKGALEVLMEQLTTETNSRCTSKLFFALASLVRGFQLGMEKFISTHMGITALKDILVKRTIIVEANVAASARSDKDWKERQTLLRKLLFFLYSTLSNDIEKVFVFQNQSNIDAITNTILPIVIQCTGYMPNSVGANDTGYYIPKENIEGNFQLNDVARQTLLSILKSDCLFFEKTAMLYPNFFENLREKVVELEKIEGEEAMYIVDEVAVCKAILTCVPCFEASSEWKKVVKGQAVPAGLEIRSNFETGETFARQLPQK